MTPRDIPTTVAAGLVVVLGTVAALPDDVIDAAIAEAHDRVWSAYLDAAPDGDDEPTQAERLEAMRLALVQLDELDGCGP